MLPTEQRDSKVGLRRCVCDSEIETFSYMFVGEDGRSGLRTVLYRSIEISLFKLFLSEEQPTRRAAKKSTAVRTIEEEERIRLIPRRSFSVSSLAQSFTYLN